MFATQSYRGQQLQRWGCRVYSRWSHQRMGQPTCGEAGPHQHFCCKDSSKRHCFWPFKGIWDRYVQAYATFKSERLERDPPAKKFHDLMKTNRLKTFSNMCKKKEVKSSGGGGGDDIEGRQIRVWSHHSDSTRTQPQDGWYPFLSHWTIAMDSGHSWWIVAKEQQSFFSRNFAEKCESDRTTPRKFCFSDRPKSEGWSRYFWRCATSIVLGPEGRSWEWYMLYLIHTGITLSITVREYREVERPAVSCKASEARSFWGSWGVS